MVPRRATLYQSEPNRGVGSQTPAPDHFRLESLSSERVSAATFRDRLGVSESGFAYLIKHGRIPEPFRIDGARYWSRAVVDQVAAQRERHRASTRRQKSPAPPTTSEPAKPTTPGWSQGEFWP
jgi:hypothetical protein